MNCRGISGLALDQIRVVIRKRITCMNCLQSDDREDVHRVVKLNVAKPVNAAFENFLNEEVILDRECPVCFSKHNASHGKESGGRWKVSDHSIKKIFVE